MIDKIRNILTILLIVLVVFAIVYSIVNILIKVFDEPVILSLENLQDYTKQENIITNYHTYYFIDECLANFIEACEKEKYEELYRIYIEDYKKQYSKEEIISKLSSIPVRHATDSIDFTTKYNLNTVYSVNNEYLLEVVINNETIYLVFRMDNTGKSEYSYHFAFLK